MVDAADEHMAETSVLSGGGRVDENVSANLAVAACATEPRSSPVRTMDLTAAVLRRELLTVRNTCKDADLIMEHAERVHDEYALEEADTDADSYDVMLEFLDRFKEALAALQDVEVDEVPPAFGFADRTIIAEVASTRSNLQDAAARCRAKIACITARVCHYREEDSTADAAGAAPSCDELMLAEQMDVLSTKLAPAPHLSPTHADEMLRS